MKIGITYQKQREGVYDVFRHITPSFSMFYRHSSYTQSVDTRRSVILAQEYGFKELHHS